MVMTLNHNSKWTISVKKVKIRFKMINNISISVKIFQNILFHVAIKYILTRFVRSRSTDRYAWTTNLSVRWSVLVFLIKIDYFFQICDNMSKVPDKSDAVCGNDGITYSNQVRIFGFFWIFWIFGFMSSKIWLLFLSVRIISGKGISPAMNNENHGPLGTRMEF